jgi:hypothetical protein
MNKTELFNDLSRFLGFFGIFFSTMIPFLGYPFYIIALILALKNKNTKDGFYNIIFISVAILLSTVLSIFILLNLAKAS